MLKLPETDTHFRNLKKKNGYQRKALFLGLSFVRRWHIAVDVGAHCGYISKDMAPHFQQVFAFEPDPDNYRCLKENVPHNVICYREALGNAFGYGRLTTPNESNSGAWQFHLGGTQKTDTVPMMRLDSHNIEADFIKIDVQGMEYDVLLGAMETIEKHHPALLVETMMDDKEDRRIFDLLNPHYKFGVKVGKNTAFLWR